MKHIPFNPTDEQRANLLRLAAHLDLGVTNLQFDMADFSDMKWSGPHECGTVGCAVGHGPSLGVAGLKDEGWVDYAYRAFAADQWGGATDYLIFVWMFDSEWACIDNTPRGAAARIYYALKHGIPENAVAQSEGKAPLSYTIPARIEGPVIPARAEATP